MEPEELANVPAIEIENMLEDIPYKALKSDGNYAALLYRRGAWSFRKNFL
jgi:hypothetical protein